MKISQRILQTSRMLSGPKLCQNACKANAKKLILKNFTTLQKNKKRKAEPTLNDTETQYGQWFARTDKQNTYR